MIMSQEHRIYDQDDDNLLPHSRHCTEALLFFAMLSFTGHSAFPARQMREIYHLQGNRRQKGMFEDGSIRNLSRCERRIALSGER